MESPYRATLTSIFPDGTRRERKNVEGVLQRKYLNNIRADYSRVYEIKELKVMGEDKNEVDHSIKWEHNDKRSSSVKNRNTQDHNNNGNYIFQDWNNNNNDNQKTKNQMLSDEITQKTLTRKSEKEKELPLISKTHNSAQKQLSVSNITMFMYLVTLFSTVLSVHFSRSYSIEYYMVLS